MQKYKIFVPSRRRPENSRRIRGLLGDGAVMFVHEYEADAYRVHGLEVRTHAIVGSMARIRNAILDCALREADAVVMCDDDLRHVVGLASEKCVKYTDCSDILAIIENGVDVMLDSGAAMFGWSRNANPLQFFPHDPVRVAAPMAGCFICGRRTARADERLTTFEDVDMTMASIKSGRFVLADVRFYFAFGAVWKGSGGNQGVRTADNEEIDRGLLKIKWGRYLNSGRSRNTVRCRDGVSAMSVVVERRSNLATTK